MKSTSRNTLAAALLAAGLAFTAAAPTASAADAGRQITPEMQQRMQSRQQARLDKMAERLQITAAQQDAWQAYVKVRKDMFDGSFTRAPKDADAATLARHRADRAAQMAQKLATLADATAKLQSALTPEQVKTLTDLTRHPMGHGKGKRGDFDGRGKRGDRGDRGDRNSRGGR
ncbi:MAG: Spy/CpxP family protein refolding chaperone [Zoogloeaceae bacterium]|jgi:hypothetical protein|nr:Spy/CpxP family protein refolding chaperone [Zoogloeaceae bacterium]